MSFPYLRRLANRASPPQKRLLPQKHLLPQKRLLPPRPRQLKLPHLPQKRLLPPNPRLLKLPPRPQKLPLPPIRPPLMRRLDNNQPARWEAPPWQA